MPLLKTVSQVTIPNGTALSNSINLGAKVLAAIVVPSAWTAAGLSFQASDDGGATWFNLYDSTGTEVSVSSASVVAGRRISLNPSLFAGVDFIKVRSGTSGTPVNQGADRVTQLISVDSAQAFGFSSGSGGTAGSQTPWLSDIDGNTHALSNASAITLYPNDNAFVRALLISNLNTGANAISGIRLTDSTQNTQGYIDVLPGNFGDSSAANNLSISATGTTMGMLFQTNAGVRMAIKASGNVGIGLSNPTHTLQLANDDAAKLTTSTWTIASDARMKQNVEDLEGGLDVIAQLRPVVAEYNGVDNTPDGGRVVSFIAQEVAKILPNCVTSHKGKLKEDGEETDLYDLNIHEILMHLVLAVKQLAEAR